MRQVFNQIQVSLALPRVRRTPEQALREVTSKSGLGVYASADRLFKGAVFGRDSLEVAEDLLYIKPRLVRQILLTMGALQGEVDNDLNEEEPGKIIHEYRTPSIDGKPLNATSREIYDRLTSIWGGDQHSLAYYGSIDSTPLFIKVLSTYCQEYGMEILLEQVISRSGHRRSMIDVLEGAIDWLVKHLDDSQSGFVEYLRRNPRGIENQVWKDSAEFYVHNDGQLANHSRPISSIEVQSLAYDALEQAGDILPSRRSSLEKYSDKIKRLVFEKLWMNDQDYFALGTDFDDNGQLRVIQTITANPAAMLDSRIFDKLPLAQKEKFISGIIREINGTSFITDAGFRSRALSEAELIENWDYHGSFVTWPKETYDIAKGQRRQGFAGLAREPENRLVNVVRASRSYSEFFYVDARGRVLGVPTRSKSHGDIVAVLSTNKPERIQAWTVSAIVAIQRGQRAWIDSNISQEPWRAQLEKEVLSFIPHVPRLRGRRELSARYPFYPYHLEEGNK
jgi:glycogen debranching enzyme